MAQILDNALALPGALLFVLCLSAKYVTPVVRRTIGKRVCAIAFRQYKGVARLQQCLRHPVLDVLTKLTALTVSVEWYLLSLPPLMWLFGQRGLLAAMAICQCMAVSTYMTCVLKDMLSCPRPYMFADGAAAGAAAGGGEANAADSLLDRASAAPDTPKASPCDAPAAEPGSPAAVVEAQITTAPAPTQIKKTRQQPPNTANHSAAATASEDSGKVTLLEAAYRNEVEYGAPSMHTWCAFVMPAYAAAVAAQLGAVGAARAAALTAGAGCWAMWVGLTRLYLGVHTPIDLVLGALGGGSVLGLWRRLGLAQIAAAGAAVPPAAAATAAAAGAALWPGDVDVSAAAAMEGEGCGAAWMMWFGFGVGRRFLALAAVGALYLTALATYPVPESHTTSYEYAVIFLGAAYGGLLSCNPSCSLLSPLLQRPAGTLGDGLALAIGGGGGGGSSDPATSQLAAAGSGSEFGSESGSTIAQALSAAAPPALRHPAAVVMLGFAFVAAVKLLSKALLSELLPRLLECLPLRLRLLWQPPVHPSGCVAAQCRLEKEKEEVHAAAAAAAAPAAICEGPRGGGVLMKTPTLPYDVDFLRKFLNYGLTVYAAMEFRYVAEVLLLLRGGVLQ